MSYKTSSNVAMHYKTSGDFIIAEHLSDIAITGKQATRFFLLWSPSNASSFLHLQLDQETGAGKEPKNSVVSQLSSDIFDF